MISVLGQYYLFLGCCNKNFGGKVSHSLKFPLQICACPEVSMFIKKNQINVFEKKVI